jgi:hypothetical protein
MIAAGVGGAAASAPHTAKAGSSLPTIKVVDAPGKFKVSGDTTFQAGRVRLDFTAKQKERETVIARLHDGYTFKKLRADVRAFGEKAGQGPHGSTPKSALKHLDRAVKNVDFYGGIDALPGQKESATMVLPTAGTYLVVEDTGNLPRSPHKLTVTGSMVNRPGPKSDATVTALTKRRFGGAKTLPAKGTITFKNKSKESPHFLGLLHVKKGTTKKEVEQGLQSRGRPDFALPGQASTEIVGEGNSQTLTYDLHNQKGEYVEACFFPDPKTGMPHAFMGMLRIVTLK